MEISELLINYSYTDLFTRDNAGRTVQDIARKQDLKKIEKLIKDNIGKALIEFNFLPNDIKF